MEVTINSKRVVDIDDETAEYITTEHIKNHYWEVEELLDEDSKYILKKAYTYFSGKQLD